ncbi:hypothetical protein [Methylobacter sp.]|uniref:hypothetical protein n=1 Tax=Methylobacter sp. TaxID=2051955 RepID=UPI002487BF89|nr:hypothetical protein [Methylobacter sp.]MDI1279283.1 hypothetical protein [Methylobacter sp.]
MSIVALVAFSGGSGAGWYLTDAMLGKQIAQMEAVHANERAVAEQVYRDRFTAAQALGDTLSERLTQTESQLIQKTKELSHALSKVTTGRACFNGATVRLLNGTDTDTAVDDKTTGPSATEDGAVATDTDVAGWIGNAQGQYETCRARLGALIDFETNQEPQHD